LPSYLLNASACPILPTPTTGLQDPTSPNPLVFDDIVQGEASATARGKLNEGMAFTEMMGRHGGGCYAVATGLNLSIGATLHVTVAPGFAMIDGPVPVTVATDVTVPNTITNGTIWLTQAGALTPSSNLVAPAGNCALVGLYTSAGGVVTVVDESGVLRLDLGLMPMRQTADLSMPTDTPPATLRFLNKCPAGVFLWDGAAYHRLIAAAEIVEANTAGSGSPNILLASESHKMFSNEGAAALNYHTLPTAAAGLEYTFVVQDADGIRVVANTGDTIRLVGSVSAAAGRIDSTTIGSTVRLVAINATEWVGIAINGTWSVT
jgi:hypothetical protein